MSIDGRTKLRSISTRTFIFQGWDFEIRSVQPRSNTKYNNCNYSLPTWTSSKVHAWLWYKNDENAQVTSRSFWDYLHKAVSLKSYLNLSVHRDHLFTFTTITCLTRHSKLIGNNSNLTSNWLQKSWSKNNYSDWWSNLVSRWFEKWNLMFL